MAILDRVYRRRRTMTRIDRREREEKYRSRHIDFLSRSLPRGNVPSRGSSSSLPRIDNPDGHHDSISVMALAAPVAS